MTDLLDDDGLLDIGPKNEPETAMKPVHGQRRATPEQNAALRDWTAPSRPQTESCHLCGRPPRLKCEACGRGACSADSWVMLGLCRHCATEERVKAWHHDRDVSENWL